MAGCSNQGVNGETLDLGVVSGTIVRVPEPPATGPGVPFAGAGRTSQANGNGAGSPLPAWTAEGTISSQHLDPGDTLRVQGTVRMQSPALTTAGAMQVGTRLTLERLSAPDGASVLARNSLASVFLTPTGLPIEREPRGFNDPLDRFVNVSSAKTAPDQAEAVFDLSLPVPSSLPAGYYRPLIIFNFQGVPVESPPLRWVVGINDSRQPRRRIRRRPSRCS